MKDREKEFQERIKCGIAYCEDIVTDKITQKDKNKIIEELVKAISIQCGECYTCEFGNMQQFGCCSDYLIANELYEQGYRKIPEDSVVLSTKEYNIHKGFSREEVDEISETAIKNSRKRTAEKILTKLQPYIGGWVLFKELEKEYGIKIEIQE